MPIVLKSGNLNLLEPSGPVQACNGIALPFTVDTLNRCKFVRVLGQFAEKAFNQEKQKRIKQEHKNQHRAK
jgi:hypothetical protein